MPERLVGKGSPARTTIQALGLALLFFLIVPGVFCGDPKDDGHGFWVCLGWFLMASVVLLALLIWHGLGGLPAARTWRRLLEVNPSRRVELFDSEGTLGWGLTATMDDGKTEVIFGDLGDDERRPTTARTMSGVTVRAERFRSWTQADT
jgi:hypothetical protein